MDKNRGEPVADGYRSRPGRPIVDSETANAPAPTAIGPGHDPQGVAVSIFDRIPTIRRRRARQLLDLALAPYFA